MVAKIAELSKKIDSKNTKEVEQVATIAANSDPVIGKKIAEAMDKRRCGKHLSPEDLRMLIAWIDLWAMFRSDFSMPRLARSQVCPPSRSRRAGRKANGGICRLPSAPPVTS